MNDIPITTYEDNIIQAIFVKYSGTDDAIIKNIRIVSPINIANTVQPSISGSGYKER